MEYMADGVSPRSLRKRKLKVEQQYSMEFINDSNNWLWVCCEKCEKWRRCYREYGEHEIFYCEQNNWDEYNRCHIPEQKQPVKKQKFIEYSEDEDFSPLDNERAWVQCLKCNKWRQLAAGQESWNSDFVCNMNNWDGLYDSCDKPEDATANDDTTLANDAYDEDYLQLAKRIFSKYNATVKQRAAAKVDDFVQYFREVEETNNDGSEKLYWEQRMTGRVEKAAKQPRAPREADSNWIPGAEPSMAYSPPSYSRKLTSYAPPVRYARNSPFAAKKGKGRARKPPCNSILANLMQPFGIHGPHLRLWFIYIAERHRVHKKWRARDPQPWTNDQIIPSGRMCNVFRHLDRESVYVVAKIIKPLRDKPHDLLFNLIIFRCYLNWSKAMDIVGLQSCTGFNEQEFLTKLLNVQQTLGKVSNAAYNVGSFSAYRAHAEGAGSKNMRATMMFSTIKSLIPAMADAIMARKDSDFTFQSLTSIDGVGKFIGYQICVDIGYWDHRVYDESLHTYLGPGAAKGLQWLFTGLGEVNDEERLRLVRQLETLQFEVRGSLHVALGVCLFPLTILTSFSLGLPQAWYRRQRAIR
jgi:hypothetical protein